MTAMTIFFEKLWGRGSKGSIPQKTTPTVDNLERSKQRNENGYYWPDDAHTTVVNTLKAFAKSHRMQLTKEDQEYVLEKIKNMPKSVIAAYYQHYNDNVECSLRIPLKGMTMSRNKTTFSIEEVLFQKGGKANVSFKPNYGKTQTEIFLLS
jgi:superoxide dismutase